MSGTMSKSVSVLFVCTGNICRSPTAEGLFRAHVEKAGMTDRFLIDSAGTGDWHVGNPPDPRSVATARARGLDISQLRARQLCDNDYKNFDVLIALDRSHYEYMQARKPASSTAQLSLLMSHADGSEHDDVPDPYTGSQKDFDRAYDMMDAGVIGLLATLNKNAGTP